jgi:hypothetical protein
MATVQIKVPPKLKPVFLGPARVRGAYGGRGSAKTRTFAKMAAVKAYQFAQAGREGIVLCCRQFMNSLDESSLEEIKAAIRSEPWLLAHFEIGEKFVRTRDGRVAFKFVGLDRNIDSIKSKARILLCWVDEAEPVTEGAWQKLIPTIREEDSELWVTWNPERETSPTHKRFRLSTADDMKSASATSLPTRLMEYRAFWDIGTRDATAIWIAQFVGREIRVLDYYEAVGQPLAAHLGWLRDRGDMGALVRPSPRRGASGSPDRRQVRRPHRAGGLPHADGQEPGQGRGHEAGRGGKTVVPVDLVQRSDDASRPRCLGLVSRETRREPQHRARA